MTPLTRQEKINIYSDLLNFTESVIANNVDIGKGICIHLRDKLTFLQQMEGGRYNPEAPYFPEWMAQKPAIVPGGNWWGWSTEDNIKRAEALRAAINLVKKEFALEQIAQYVKDPATCGMNGGGGCCNITPDRLRMCVAGKNLLPEVRDKHPNDSISWILGAYDNDQSRVFIPESVGILSNVEWQKLQDIHDSIGTNGIYYGANERVSRLDLFTIDEFNALK